MAAGGMSGLPDTPRPSRFVNGRKKSLYNETVRLDKCYEHNLTCIKFSILHFLLEKNHTKWTIIFSINIEISKHECCMPCSHDN